MSSLPAVSQSVRQQRSRQHNRILFTLFSMTLLMNLRYLSLLIFCLLSAAAFAEPEVSVRMDRTEIFRGETFLYFLTLSDSVPVSNAAEPDISAWTDFRVQPLPKESSQTGSSIFIVNGKVVNQSHTTTYGYVLEPKRSGLLTIPLPKITVNGITPLLKSFSVDGSKQGVSANGAVNVRVVEPEQQDTVILTIETGKTRLYPLQPLDVALVIRIKALPGQHADVEPLSLLRQPPQLQIPWAKENFAKGMNGEENLEAWLNKILVRPPQKGFAINNYGGTRLSFGFFDDMLQREVYQFSGKPKLVQYPDFSGKPVDYWEYRFLRRFVPQEFGTYAFGPAALKGLLPAADSNAAKGIAAKNFYAVAPSVSVTVADVPQENRPADYIGAFGTFRWDVRLEPAKARTGDPMTLTLRLTGQGSTANVRPPDFASVPEIAENFRVHLPPTEETDERSCAFIYTIRPKKAGPIVFPPLSVSVFDVNTETFQTLKSSVIPLEIAETKTVQSAESFGNLHTDESMQISEKGLFANKTSPEVLLPILTYKHWAISMAVLAVTYALAAVSVLLRQNRRQQPSVIRRRGALGRAKKLLPAVRSTEDLQTAVFGFAADIANADENGMTTADACRLLREQQIPEMLVRELQDMLETLDAAVYGGMSVSPLEDLTRTAETLLTQMTAPFERFSGIQSN
jgi:hypothetical protein